MSPNQVMLANAVSEANKVSAVQAIASVKTSSHPSVTEEEMRQAVRTLLIGLGEDPDREGLKDTPKRMVKALRFLTKGYTDSLEYVQLDAFPPQLQEDVM